MAWSALFMTSHTWPGSDDRLFIGAVSRSSPVRRAAEYRPTEPITFLRKTHALSQASAATNEPTKHSDRACCCSLSDSVLHAHLQRQRRYSGHVQSLAPP